jgi:hypothetical protein
MHQRVLLEVSPSKADSQRYSPELMSLFKIIERSIPEKHSGLSPKKFPLFIGPLTTNIPMAQCPFRPVFYKRNFKKCFWAAFLHFGKSPNDRLKAKAKE